MRHPIPTAVAAAALSAGLLAGCGNPAPVTPASSAAATPASPSVTPSAVHTSPAARTSPTAVPGNPPGFTPLSFTAISATHWWVLGSVPCGARECPVIETTTDGGATFTRLPAPGGPFGPGLNSPPAAANIRFADPEDGWVFGPRLYDTHDGGRTWSEFSMLGQVTDVEPGLGAVFATVMMQLPCADHGTCTSADEMPNLWYDPSPARDAWGIDAAAGVVTEGLAVHGHSVWVVNSMSTRDGPAIGTGLLHSADGGSTFAVEPEPIPGIACFYSPASDSVIWSYCSGGHFMFAYRSTDGGAHFSAAATDGTTAPTPDGFPNGSTLVAASATVAAAASDLPGGSLIRTTDGGATWTVVQRPPDQAGTWYLIGFTTPQAGYALWQHGGASYRASAAQLWHTTDGGATWSPVTIR